MLLKTSGSFFSIFLLLQTVLSAQPGDSDAYFLHPHDSVLVTVEYGQKTLYHRVKPGQTLFGIARFYGIEVEDLFSYNPEYEAGFVLEAGQQVRVPVPNRAIYRFRNTGFLRWKYTPVYYIVQQGETLYQISKRHFNMPVDTVLKRNKLASTNLSPGQLLHVAWINRKGVPPEWQKNSGSPGLSPLQEEFETDQEKYKKQVEDQGVCFWHKAAKNAGDFYALHNKAKAGSVMAVTNPINNRTIYAKVIGKIPSGYKKNIDLILSPDAAKKLGALDPQFFVKMKYYQ